MGGKIAFMFVMIIVAGIGLYLYQSGAIGNGFNFLNSLSTRTSTTPTYFSSSPSSGSGGTKPPPQPSPPPPPPTPAPYMNPADIPPGYTVAQLSPYFHIVRFGSISPGASYSYGQIILSPNLPNASATIDVTGWQIKSNYGGEYIPQAVNLYDASGLAPATDIRLKSGDYLYLYSTSAPVNLRLNKCMGYLPNRNQFNPQLPQDCPYVDRSNIGNLSGACQNYILSLGHCQSPDFGSSNFPRNDYACEDYLKNRFNYRSCLDEHQTDPDFFSREVHVWMGSSPVDPFHDRVLLLDTSGLIVDYNSY